MAYNYTYDADQDTNSDVLTTNQNYLSRISGRKAGLLATLEIGNGLLTRKQYDSYLQYLNNANTDIISKMSSEELTDYDNKTAGKSVEELAQELKAVEKQMDTNKDRASH